MNQNRNQSSQNETNPYISNKTTQKAVTPPSISGVADDDVPF